MNKCNKCYIRPSFSSKARKVLFGLTVKKMSLMLQFSYAKLAGLRPSYVITDQEADRQRETAPVRGRLHVRFCVRIAVRFGAKGV
jgi:hypothetical protein